MTWGSGASFSSSNLAAGVFAFNFSHRYLDDIPGASKADISVTIMDKDGGSLILNTNVSIQNLPPSTPVLNLNALTINENDSATLTVSFSDAGTLDTHMVTINWGDGSLNSVSNLAAGLSGLSATHIYRDDSPTATISDLYSISVTVLDDDGGSASSGISIRVNNVAPVLSNVAITSPIIAGTAATLTGNISDVGSLDTFALTVNWGMAGQIRLQIIPLGLPLSTCHIFTPQQQQTAPWDLASLMMMEAQPMLRPASP